MQQISVFQQLIIKLLTFHDTTNVALIVSTRNLDFSFDHIVFITENILSAGAVLPGRQRINSTILQKSWKFRHFSLISEKYLCPSIRYRNVSFIPCIQLPHNYRFYEGSLIEYASFFCSVRVISSSFSLSCISFHSGVFFSNTHLNFSVFPKLHFHLLTYSKLVS
jgi:hypothetical protein